MLRTDLDTQAFHPYNEDIRRCHALHGYDPVELPNAERWS